MKARSLSPFASALYWTFWSVRRFVITISFIFALIAGAHLMWLEFIFFGLFAAILIASADIGDRLVRQTLDDWTKGRRL